jgi:hypothetical protein
MGGRIILLADSPDDGCNCGKVYGSDDDDDDDDDDNCYHKSDNKRVGLGRKRSEVGTVTRGERWKG